MLKNFVNTVELQKQMNHEAISKFNVPKSNSISFDKYQVPVTVQSNTELEEMVRKLLEIEQSPEKVQGSSNSFKVKEKTAQSLL